MTEHKLTKHKRDWLAPVLPRKGRRTSRRDNHHRHISL